MEKTDHDHLGKVITYCSLSLACETSPVMDMLFPSYILYLPDLPWVISDSYPTSISSAWTPIVEHKSLSHNKLAIFRVVVLPTLKMANYLITSRLCTTPHTQHRQTFFRTRQKKRQYHTEQVGVGMGLHLQGLRFLRGIFRR